MTIDEFNNTRFGAGMKVIYNGVERKIAAVNFPEALIGLDDGESFADLDWVRCENCILKAKQEPK